MESLSLIKYCSSLKNLSFIHKVDISNEYDNIYLQFKDDLFFNIKGLKIIKRKDYINLYIGNKNQNNDNNLKFNIEKIYKYGISKVLNTNSNIVDVVEYLKSTLSNIEYEKLPIIIKDFNLHNFLKDKSNELGLNYIPSIRVCDNKKSKLTLKYSDLYGISHIEIPKSMLDELNLDVLLNAFNVQLLRLKIYQETKTLKNNNKLLISELDKRGLKDFKYLTSVSKIR